MGGRFVIWIVLSMVLGSGGVLAAAEAGAPILVPYSFVLPAGWLLAVIISLLLAWALRLLPGSRDRWFAITITAGMISFVSTNPVLLFILAAYECGIENRMGGHCIFL